MVDHSKNFQQVQEDFDKRSPLKAKNIISPRWRINNPNDLKTIEEKKEPASGMNSFIDIGDA